MTPPEPHIHTWMVLIRWATPPTKKEPSSPMTHVGKEHSRPCRQNGRLAVKLHLGRSPAHRKTRSIQRQTSLPLTHSKDILSNRDLQKPTHLQTHYFKAAMMASVRLIHSYYNIFSSFLCVYHHRLWYCQWQCPWPPQSFCSKVPCPFLQFELVFLLCRLLPESSQAAAPPKVTVTGH